jgi:hypothetical protein
MGDIVFYCYGCPDGQRSTVHGRRRSALKSPSLFWFFLRRQKEREKTTLISMKNEQ